MILYFSGTGNTAFAARQLADNLGDDELIRLDGELLLHPETFTLAPKGERIVWAFPIYSWGVPPVVADFINWMKIADNARDIPNFMLATCGDDIGCADRQWRRLMASRGLTPSGAFAIQMPNTYVSLPGFDIDPEDVERRKLTEAPAAVRKIADAILNGSADILIRLSFSGIKTYLIYPLFARYAMSAKPFNASDACISCGRCAAMCPMLNIRMADGAPRWADHCAGCLRCYHICPVHAINYGSRTRSKGQYSAMISQLS